MQSGSGEFAKCMRPVAMRVLPEEGRAFNKALSAKDELRFGAHGALSVDAGKGTWHDHEAQCGGGVIDLLTTFKGLSKGEAVKWLAEEGYIEERQRPEIGHAPNGAAAGTSPQGKFAGFMDDWPIAAYTYQDRDDNLAYEVLKFAKTAPRRFMQRRPHPSGKGWIWGLQSGEYGCFKPGGDWFKARDDKSYAAKAVFDDAPRFLYRHADMLKAKAAGRPIYLAEGEKDAETLREWGFDATTNAGGAKYWSDEFDADLSGADVVLLPDNDDSGRVRVLTRGAGLRGKAKSVKVLDLSLHWSAMPEKGDVTDWKDKGGGTADAFKVLAARAPLWRPVPPPSKFRAVRWADLDEKAPDVDYLIDGWLTEGERSVLGGASRSGKSFLAIHAAMCVARGQDFFDFQVKRGGVVYQAGEGPRGVKRRLKAYRKHFQVADDEDVPFVFLGSRVDLYSKDGDTDNLIAEIKAHALTFDYPLRLVVIDTLATATAGADENSGKDMGVVLANIARIAEETGAHVMLVHHMNASGAKLRGHTSVYANVDQVLLVENDPETKIRTVTLDKQKDDEDGVKIRFALAPITIGYNQRTERDITSCVVLSVNEKERLKKEEARLGFSVNPKERSLLMNMFEALDKYGEFAAEARDGIPRAAIGKNIVRWDYYRTVAMEKMPEVEDRKKAADLIRKEFSRAKDGLLRYGIIKVSNPYMWWDGKPIRGFSRTFQGGQQVGQMEPFAGTNGGQMAIPPSGALQPDDDEFAAGLLL